MGFKLTFNFGENPHFSNTTLEKTYLMEDMENLIPSKFMGTSIDWKPGMDTTVQVRGAFWNSVLDLTADVRSSCLV